MGNSDWDCPFCKKLVFKPENKQCKHLLRRFSGFASGPFLTSAAMCI